MARTDPRVAQPSWLNPYDVTKNWDRHMESPGLGGTDWGMRKGTNLMAPAGGGVIEQVTPGTKVKPAWYNSGLGYATAVRRPNGTRTIYAHNSSFVVGNGATVGGLAHIAESGGGKGDPGAGTSTGEHVHIHDLLADGKTRVPAFSTVTATAGGTTPIPTQSKGDGEMFLTRDVQTGAVWLYTSNGRVHLQDPNVVNFFVRAFSSYPNYQNFYGAELQLMYNYIDAASNVDDDERAAILAAVKAVPSMSPAAVSKIITDAVNAALAGADVTVEVDYAKIEDAVNTAIADEFAATQAAIAGVPDAVNDNAAERMQS